MSYTINYRKPKNECSLWNGATVRIKNNVKDTQIELTYTYIITGTYVISIKDYESGTFILATVGAGGFTAAGATGRTSYISCFQAVTICMCARKPFWELYEYENNPMGFSIAMLWKYTGKPVQRLYRVDFIIKLFYGAYITDIPMDLFADCGKLTDLSSCFASYRYLTNWRGHFQRIAP